MTRRLPHRLAVLATIAVAGLGLVACSGGSTTSSGTGGGSAAASAGASAGASGAAGAGCSKPIGVSVADQKSLFYVAAVQGMQAAADKAGCELKVTSANNNSSQQVEQVND